MSDLAREYVKRIDKGRVSPSAKMLLFLLADYHNEARGCAFPGIDTLCEITELTARHLRNLLGELTAAGLVRYTPGIGRGNLGQFVFLELAKAELGKGEPAAPFFDRKGEVKGEVKGEKSGIAITKNHEPGTKTLPNPPLQGGNLKSLTPRQLKELRLEIQCHLDAHKDRYGHARYDGEGNPMTPSTVREAVEMSCLRLLIPLEQAWRALEAAGIDGEARKEPQRAAG